MHFAIDFFLAFIFSSQTLTHLPFNSSGIRPLAAAGVIKSVRLPQPTNKQKWQISHQSSANTVAKSPATLLEAFPSPLHLDTHFGTCTTFPNSIKWIRITVL
jgi:hypothetical protein